VHADGTGLVLRPDSGFLDPMAGLYACRASARATMPELVSYSELRIGRAASAVRRVAERRSSRWCAGLQNRAADRLGSGRKMRRGAITFLLRRREA